MGHRHPETLAREEALAKKKKMEETDEEETMRFIERQAERARMREPGDDDAADGEPSTSKELDLNHTKIEVKVACKATTDSAAAAPVIKTAFPLMVAKASAVPGATKKAVPKKRSALDELRDEEERVKEAKNRKNYWLHEVGRR